MSVTPANDTVTYVDAAGKLQQAMGVVVLAGGGAGGPVTSDDITDATDVGREVLTATDGAAVRSAIGAGTSSLVIGTGATDAKAGNYSPPVVTTTVNGLMPFADKIKLNGIATSANNYSLPNAAVSTRGGVLQGAAVADAVDETDVVAQFNSLLASLRTAGAIVT